VESLVIGSRTVHFQRKETKEEMALVQQWGMDKDEETETKVSEATKEEEMVEEVAMVVEDLEAVEMAILVETPLNIGAKFLLSMGLPQSNHQMELQSTGAPSARSGLITSRKSMFLDPKTKELYQQASFILIHQHGWQSQ
jgi:hypothetical protein